MLPGLSGSLVSEYFAERLLLDRFRGEAGEATRDAARRGLSGWRRDQGRDLGPVSTPRILFDRALVPLARLLGFAPGAPRAVGRSGLLAGEDSRPGAPLFLAATWGEDLGAAWRESVREAFRTDRAWCVLSNGREVRLVDARRSYARQYLAFDLDGLVEDPHTFAVFWALLRPEALAPFPASPALIDRVIHASALETMAVCRGLQAGVLDALGALLSSLAGRSPRAAGGAPTCALSQLHEQALTIVYRILFLLFAESRHLLPTWHPVYRESYSMEAVRALAERPGAARGLWETIQAISRLAHAGCRAGDLQVTPFNGRLFAPSLTPAGEHARVTDETARRAVLALSTTPSRRNAPGGRIAYRDLGVEQLGSVYERVLDYRVAWRGNGEEGTVRLEPGAGVRKATGTFYTPRPITSFIVRRVLAPLVRDRPADAVLGLRVVDPAMGSGAFLVAACRYLAAAYEAALIREGSCHPGEVTEEDRRGFRRLVAQHCLYGVDLNPMAVQLARLSLWLATLAPDRPLTFLDHRLLVGDSLVGASVDDMSRRPTPSPRAGRRPGGESPLLPLFSAEAPGAALRTVVPWRQQVESTPDDSLAVVREKERVLATLGGPASPLARWKQLADAWCALGLGVTAGHAPPPGLFAALADHALRGESSLGARRAGLWLDEIAQAARAGRYFHWSLEFPEVFYDSSGAPRPDAGFDAVLGNPPWDMIRGDNEGADDRAASRAETGRLSRFARASGLYQAIGEGHANRFQLFLERGLRLVHAHGRFGMVLPWGLASDSGCAPLRRMLLERCTLDPLLCFDNGAAIFPIHRSVRFVLLTGGAGGETKRLACRLGERELAVLDTLPDQPEPAEECRVALSRELLARISGPDLSIPNLRTAADGALLEKLVSAWPGLSAREGWRVEFGRELNATEDRSSFSEDGRGLPVLEGKHVQPFRVDSRNAVHRLPLAAAPRLYPRGDAFRHARLAYRDVASATNRLTLIAAVVPARVVTVHTLFCLRNRLPRRDQWFLCGILNSFVANYLVRLRVTTHVTVGIVSRLPVPRPAPGCRAVISISRLAQALSRSTAPEEDTRYARLQAEVASLYGLTDEELEHVLGTFPLVGEKTKEETRRAWQLMRVCERIGG